MIIVIIVSDNFGADILESENISATFLPTDSVVKKLFPCHSPGFFRSSTVRITRFLKTGVNIQRGVL